MFHCSIHSLLFSALLVASSGAVTLFAAHSDGNVTSLTLAGSGASYNLSVAARTSECEGNPSWLTLDHDNRVLYCLDRGAGSAKSGSLNSFSVGADGALTRLARVDAPLSGVSGDLVPTTSGPRGYVSASYNKSASAVYTAARNGSLTGPLQQFFPNLTQPGPVLARQDTSYLHQVLVDPENKYVIMNDLGGDLVRVFSYDFNASAPLSELASLVTEPATGPRHGVFWKSGNGTLYYFFVGELNQKVLSYRVEYTDTGLAWSKVFEIPALGTDGEVPALTSPTSEIALTPDQRFIVVSNRDISFRNSTKFQSGPSDTLSTFSINDDGTLSLLQLAPSGGYSPRQFSINKAGDMIAVGHQNNMTVVVWKRDVESGKIVTEEEGGKLAVVTLTGAVVCTIWDE